MSQSSRFTAWLSEEERELLREKARDEASSENYFVRAFVRAGLGLPVPRRIRAEILANLTAEERSFQAAAR